MLKVLEPSLFQKAKSGALTLDEATKALMFAQWPKEVGSRTNRKMVGVRSNADIDLNAEEWRGFVHSLWDFNVEKTDVVRVVANLVADRMIVPQE